MYRSALSLIVLFFIVFFGWQDVLIAQKSKPIQPTNTRSSKSSGDNITFQHISVEQGLSQANVYAILQDRTGFIWVATADGLNRYDGATFKVFRRIAGDKTALSDDFAVSLFEDSKGILWIGTRDGGINRFNAVSETFTQFKHDAANPRSLSNNFVRAIVEDKQGRLWLGTENGLNCFDTQSGIFTAFYGETPSQTSTNTKVITEPRAMLAGSNISALCTDERGKLWVGTINGLTHFDPITAQTLTSLHHNPRNPNTLSGDDIRSMLYQQGGTLWVGTFTHGLNRLSTQSLAVERFSEETASQHGLAASDICTIATDVQRNVWIGSQNNGLYVFNRTSRTFTNYRYDPTNLRGLSGNIIFALYQDRTGAFWVGTFGNGLNIFSQASRIFRGYVCDVQNPNNVRANAVYAVCEDKRGTVWLGTEDGLVRLNRATGETTRFVNLNQDPAQSRTKSIFVRCILESKADGMLWLATSNGLFKFDPVTTRFTSYSRVARPAQRGNISPLSIEIPSLDNLFTIAESANGNLWIGTLGAGILRFDPRKGSFTAQYTTQNTPLTNNIVRAICEDAKGMLWIGTRGGGLNRFNPSEARTDKAWKAYRHDENNPKTLSQDAIFSLRFDHAGVLWIGTQGGGLCRFDEASETFTAWKEEQGLANNVVYGIVEDRTGAFWMSTHQGLSRFTPNSNVITKFRNYNWRDGLQNNEFNAGAYSLGRSGRLYFGSIQGLNEFYADSLRENPYIPPIVITSFKRFGEEVRMERSITDLDTLRLSYKDNFFSLEFAALSFIQADENRFKYMLEGFDAQWINGGTRHEVRYTNLSGGEYIFHIKASNNDGVWNTQGRTLRIIVTPPFWETWWFRTSVVLAGILLLFTGYRARVRLVEGRAVELEEQVAKRTVELRESYDHLQSANEEIQRQIELLDEQTRETEMANSALQEKNLEIEDERKKTDALLLNVLPPTIAARLKAGESTIAEHFDNVTVLFADIVGFTELAAAQPAKEVVAILNTVFSAFDIFSERYNLEKIKTIGDAYMIVGGVPKPLENHAESVADMALEILQTLEILRYTMHIDLQVRIGINTGSVVAGIIGQKKFSYDLWGDTVNTASRMESHGETGKIHCTEAVYALLKDSFAFEERGETDIKGKGVMKTYFLTARLKAA
jgi:ligand-binding sensor domain-containing protein/class 3 adenylate cyclase